MPRLAVELRGSEPASGVPSSFRESRTMGRGAEPARPRPHAWALP